jgi:ubiquinone biosynthesis protein UbiJ
MTLDDRSLNSDRNPDIVANRGYWAGIALDRLERIGELQAKLNTSELAREQAERERDEARAEVTLLKSVVAEQDAAMASECEPIDAGKEKFDQMPLLPIPLGPTYAWPADHSAFQESTPEPNVLAILDGRISAVDRRVDVVREDLLHLLGQAETVAQLKDAVAEIDTEVAALLDEPEPPLPSPEQLQRVIHDQRVDLMTRRIDDVVQHVEEMAGLVTRLSSRFNLLNQGVSSPVRVTEPLPLPSNAGDYEADPNILNARVNLLQEKLAAMELQLSSVLGKTKLASKAAFADYTGFQAQLDETRQQVQETAKTIAFYWGNPLGPAALDAIRGEVKVVADSINSIRNQCGVMGVIQADFANRLADLEAPNLVLETVASEIRELKSQFESLFKGTRISFDQQDQRLTRLEEQNKERLAAKQTIERMHQRQDDMHCRIEKLCGFTDKFDHLDEEMRRERGVIFPKLEAFFDDINRLSRRHDTLKRRVRRIAAQLPKVVPVPATTPEPAKANGKPVKAASPAVPKPVGKVKTGKVKAWNKTTKPST